MQDLSVLSPSEIASFVALMSAEEKIEFVNNLTIENYLRYLESQHLNDTEEASPVLILGGFLPAKYYAILHSKFFCENGFLPPREMIALAYFALLNDPETGDFYAQWVTADRDEALEILAKAGNLPLPLDQHLIESAEQADKLQDAVFTEISKNWDEGECAKVRKYIADSLGAEHALARD